ncbi:MAG: secondary thiamine-phosphate synthase enzyme YjbQ [Desulfobacteraceae bacterium]|jgi:secondary thiamine-phosphate synthase enzyme
MPIQVHNISVKTTTKTDILDLTPQVQEEVERSAVRNGLVILFIPGSTAALTTIEYESGVINDLKKAIERMAPEDLYYEHNERWGDGNGYSHVRSALLGPSLHIPLIDGKLILGTWQQIVLLDFDNRPRKRQIIMQTFGE